MSEVPPTDPEKKHELKTMRDMVRDSTDINTGGAENKPQVVVYIPTSSASLFSNQPQLLTGVTGALGAHIMKVLLQMRIKKIICLCRASSAPEAKDRLVQSLQRRNIPLVWTRETTVQACASSFSEPHIGLPVEVYQQLTADVTAIIHCAWPVNFLAPLPSFDSAILGTKNLLELANTGTKKRFVFCSSTASVIRAPTPIREEVSGNPEHASPLGYSRSKWVAESIVRRAGGEVVRLGQLSGDTNEGIWNPEEGWPLILKTLQQVRCLPELNEDVQWLPVDLAAQAVCRIGVRPQGSHEDKKIWHVLNSRGTPWSKILDAVEGWCGGIARVPPQEWLRLLELGEQRGEAVKLLGLWRDVVSPFFLALD
jgi:thioester reductase-like protein